MKYNWKKDTPAHKLITKINTNTFANIDSQYQYLASEFSENAEEFIKQCMNNGFSLLEEAIVQNIAEECFYSSLGIQRPQQVHKKEPQVLGTNKYFKTNFDYYGIYQPLATMFARTLRGIGQSKADTDDLILNEFSKKACNENFITSIIQEYTNDVGQDKLMELIEKLGRFFNEKSATFSNNIEGKKMSILQTQELWNNIMAELRSLEDYRPVISTTPNVARNNR